MKTYTFIGPRLSKGGPIGGFGEEKTNTDQKAVIAAINTIVEEQSNDFVLVTGLAPGIEQWAAIAAMKHRRPYMVYLPFENMDSPWPDRSKIVFKQLIDGAAAVEYVSRGEYSLDKLRAKEEKLLTANQVYSFYTILPSYVKIDHNTSVIINARQNTKTVASNDTDDNGGNYLVL